MIFWERFIQTVSPSFYLLRFITNPNYSETSRLVEFNLDCLILAQLLWSAVDNTHIGDTHFRAFASTIHRPLCEGTQLFSISGTIFIPWHHDRSFQHHHRHFKMNLIHVPTMCQQDVHKYVTVWPFELLQWNLQLVHFFQRWEEIIRID